MGLLVCVWLGANRRHALTGVTGTLFSLLSCSPSCVAIGQRPAVCWQQPVKGLNVSRGE